MRAVPDADFFVIPCEESSEAGDELFLDAVFFVDMPDIIDEVACEGEVVCVEFIFIDEAGVFGFALAQWGT